MRTKGNTKPEDAIGENIDTVSIQSTGQSFVKSS